MTGYFIASASEQLSRRNSMVTEKPMNTMRILIPWTIVMKRQGPAQVTSQEE